MKNAIMKTTIAAEGGIAMLVKTCEGTELEKTSKTSPEDSFNRSIVTFEIDGRERTFHLLYLRFFEDEMTEFTPFDEDPIFTAREREVRLKDFAALVAMIKNPDYQQRKRVYLNEKGAFTVLFQDIDYDEVKKVFEDLEACGRYELNSSIPFLKQPQ